LPFAPEPAQRADHDGRLFVCGDQSGRTSAPMRPQAVQTILGHKDRTGISSGRASAFMTAL
jgi:hypothetical protein